MAFQVDYAVWQALILIADYLSSPLNNFQIIIEPRTVSEDTITRWDIGLQPADLNIEVKINPKRNDIEEWLDQISKTSATTSHRMFRLVYSEGNNPLLKATKKLLQHTIEAGSDFEKFNSLVNKDSISDAEKVLERLGANSHQILQRMSIEQIPEVVLKQQTRVLANQVAGSVGGDRLYNLLFNKFFHGVAERKCFDIKELISEIKEKGIILKIQQEVTYFDYDPLLSASIFLLQFCKSGLPKNVIAKAVGCDIESLNKIGESLIQSGKIVENENTWFINSFLNEATHKHGSEILERALNALFIFINKHKEGETINEQVLNAIAIAKKSIDACPHAVVPLFTVLDKLLKSTGDLQLVMDAARLTIDAAKQINEDERTDEQAEHVARAYVCGVSWVYQRIPGHLDDARSAYLDSRSIAEGIEAHVTLAFISKCLGRLCRMEAEQDDLSYEQKRSKLHESSDLLKESIERFENLQNFDLKAHEIADSYSLLGRTYLVAEQLPKAGEAMRKAFCLMENRHSKEFADLLILNGDFETKQGNYDAAEKAYNQALTIQLQSGAESSEIRARILRQRGLNFKAMKKPAEAKRDIEEAATIWERLNRHENAAQALCEAKDIEQFFPVQVIQMLKKEPATVKLVVAQLHEKYMAERGQKKAFLSSREQPDKKYWQQLIKDAKRQIAIRDLNE